MYKRRTAWDMEFYMKFVKMHGAGNDYVYMDTQIQPVADPAALAIRVSDRHKGIGSDGLVLIMPADAKVDAHVRMRMFNSDGSEAQMCGNAIRCVAKYAYEKGYAKDTCMRVQTQAGVKVIDVQVDVAKVRDVKMDRGRVKDVQVDVRRVVSATVDMGKPEWRPAYIPVRYTGTTDDEGRIPEKISVSTAAKVYEATCVSMGNPHAVIFGEALDTLPIETIGPVLEHHPLFPERINVEFVEVLDRNNVRMRVWERGAGETQACGTGACAVVCATARLGLTDNDVTVHVLGGTLHIGLAENGHVFMTGETVEVFAGEFLL